MYTIDKNNMEKWILDFQHQNGNLYFILNHDVQIKAGGSYAQAHHPNPDLTISLRSTHGLDFEVMNSQQTETEYHDMLPMDDAKGKWIQVAIY